MSREDLNYASHSQNQEGNDLTMATKTFIYLLNKRDEREIDTQSVTITRSEGKFVFNLEQVLRTSFSTCVLVSLLRTKCAVEMITKP